MNSLASNATDSVTLHTGPSSSSVESGGISVAVGVSSGGEIPSSTNSLTTDRIYSSGAIGCRSTYLDIANAPSYLRSGVHQGFLSVSLQSVLEITKLNSHRISTIWQVSMNTDHIVDYVFLSVVIFFPLSSCNNQLDGNITSTHGCIST